MIITNEAYIKYVLDDIKNNKGLFHPVKSPAIFRLRPINVIRFLGSVLDMVLLC